MGIEIDPKTPAEKTLTIRLEDGKELFFPDQKWYPVTKTIADALQKQRRDVGMRLHQVISKNPGINFMTVKELEMSGRLMELESEERSQTIICDQDNFKKIILAYPLAKEAEPSRKASSTPRKPQLPSNFNPLSQLDGEKKPPLPPASKDMPTIRMPYQILAVNSVKDILSHLLDGTLSQVPHDLRKYLEEITQKYIVESAFSPEELLRHILSDNSQISLKRFFRVSLDAMLYDSWDAIDINERKLKEEKEIIEICKKLKEKGYDNERVAQELLDHFPIPPKQTQEGSGQQIDSAEQMREIVIVPNPATQVVLAPVPIIRRKATIFEAGNHNHKSTHGNTGRKRINDQAALPSGQQEKDRKKLRDEILSKTTVEIRKKVLANNYIPANVRITLGHYLPPNTNIPEIFNHASQEELNKLVIERLDIALLTDPNRDKMLSKVGKILKPEEPVQDEDLHPLRRRNP